MKLGEVLVRKGAIDAAQLKEALDAQLIFGGHLGTCLIELGYVDEHGLGNVLSECFGTPYARNEVFLEIPRYVTATLPSKIVEKHSVVPFRLKNKVLDVAMIDPKNLNALDEIAFACGYGVRPWIAPEARVYQAMERYYQIVRRQRYVTLCRRLDEDCAEMVVQSSVHDGAHPAPERVPAPSPTETLAAAIVEAKQQMLVEPVSTRDSLDEVTERLCRAEGQDELAAALLAHALSHMARVILFGIQGGTASVWKAEGEGLENRRRPGPVLSIVGEPLFGLVRGQTAYVGSVPGRPEFQGFYDSLAIEPAAEIVLVPTWSNDRLIALFYGDGGPVGRIDVEAEEYRRLMGKFALGMDLVQTRRKLRSV